MLSIHKKIFICSVIFNLNSFAQNELDNEKPFEPQILNAPGVERVGSVPLPVPQYTSLPLNQNNLRAPRENISFNKKNSFESTYIPNHIIYLNGENISSVRNQDLENVNIQIDKNGNIYIDAPQYQVSVEQSYHPLLPKELPKFKKVNFYEKLSLPQGIYSKETGKPVSTSEENSSPAQITPPPLAKEIVPEANNKQSTIPAIHIDEVKTK